MKTIKRNAIRCKRCGDIVESKHIHDFQICSCGAVAADGGHFYIKRSFKQGVSDEDYEELSEWEEE